MTIPPSGGAGVPAAPTAGASPFAVTAPPVLALTPGQRTGATSFTITNLTGRPVRVRLRPRGRLGAPDSWFSVVGLVEVPMGVAETITATVNVAVPPDAPAGAAQFFLEVVAEDDTESVVGQTVAFTVPAPEVAPPRKKFPWWIIAVGVLVLALIVGGVIFFLNRGGENPSDPPVNGIAPSIFGTPQVAVPLAADNGNWRPTEGIAFEQQWQRCDAAGNGCVDIAGATQQIFVPEAQDEGSTLRVVVTATTGGGTAAKESKTVGPVAPEQRATVPPAQDLVVVPVLTNLSTSEAAKVAAAAGLRIQIVFNGAVCVSDVQIENQSPAAESSVPRGSTVRVFVPSKNPRLCLINRPPR
jgi:hypothetical protein